ncbi:predicted protein [Plenodomus lingam JN3]|uniref:DUF7587 domain-containing protein n=1 Tax=Leptosphaeria maculans (strain JN3 / isolate v23.1.3 / race Av1-4-5-6-7-8) TaxID=985895 RepID=E5A641_LEPMJ|nr:predicted protein [Plenodomus lingam JN3]CBX99086.1 predicted protein [Plenodomus lingam JN3]
MATSALKGNRKESLDAVGASSTLPRTTDDFGGILFEGCVPHLHHASSVLNSPSYAGGHGNSGNNIVRMKLDETRLGTSPYILQPPCTFSPPHVAKHVIEAHFSRPLAWAQINPSPFITVFDDFASALHTAYTAHTAAGATRIQIIRLNIPDLIPISTPILDDEQASYTTLYSPSTHCQLLHVPSLAAELDLGPVYTRRLSEYLACAPIPRSVMSAAWPVIGGRLFYEEEEEGWDVRDLLGEVGGRVEGDNGGLRRDEEEREGGMVYDWEERVFVEARGFEQPNECVMAGAANLSSEVGPGLFGYDGFLRGTRVVD